MRPVRTNMLPTTTVRPTGLRRPVLFAIWIAAFAILLVASNHGFLQRVRLLIGQERWGTLGGYVGMWGFCILALLIAAFQQKWWLRTGWAVVFALTAAVGVAFRTTSGTDMTVFDLISLWAAKHEAARAASFFGAYATWPLLILVLSLAVLIVRPRLDSAVARRWLTRMAFVPALPMLAIASITLVKEGGGTEGLPVQFVPISVGAVMGVRLASEPIPDRRPVGLQPEAPKVRHIVVLIDESLRGDYVDFTPGNELTPELASYADRVVNYGLAVSGGNCSHYSNSILRFDAGPQDLGGRILENPTIWQYAHKAGFETVFIDAQSAFNKTPGKLQNFMNAHETADIDRLYTMESDVPAPDLDYRLLDIIDKELKSDKPSLIYANKNGAHFPYDHDYPASARVFSPVMSESEDTPASRINSYRNAVRWTVDKFFARLFGESDLKDTVLLYTSDHGQVFDPHALTHCSVEDPNPREGLVPLFVSTGDTNLKARFAEAAKSGEHRSHFSIMPTVLSLLGYSDAGLASEKRSSTLFEAGRERLAFSSGDIFGLFSPEVRWHDLDFGQSYLEPPAQQLRISGTKTLKPSS